MIRKSGKGYVVKTWDGKKTTGFHATRADAEKADAARVAYRRLDPRRAPKAPPAAPARPPKK